MVKRRLRGGMHVTLGLELPVAEDTSDEGYLGYRWEEFLFEAEVDVTPGCAGRLSGAPENCYPSEPAEVEWLELRCEETGIVFSPEQYEEMVNWTRELCGKKPDYRLSEDDDVAFTEYDSLRAEAAEAAAEARWDAQREGW